MNALLKTFNRPICPNCRAQMVFVRASKEEPGFMQRKFKCPNCGHAETDLVKLGPKLKTRDFG